jgi:hypothetical protein
MLPTSEKLRPTPEHTVPLRKRHSGNVNTLWVLPPVSLDNKGTSVRLRVTPLPTPLLLSTRLGPLLVTSSVLPLKLLLSWLLRSLVERHSSPVSHTPLGAAP